MEKGISIIICSYNGAARIGETIRAAAAQQFPRHIPWEIIFADNASTDGSSDAARQAWSACPDSTAQFTVLHEPKPGKIYALHRAVDAARYSYFIICDDDNRLDSHYAQIAFEILEGSERIGAVGGQSEADTGNVPIPDWFPAIQTDYAIGKQAPASGDISHRGYLWGAGMASRTALYKEMYRGFPSFLSGRDGKSMVAGEDSEYCQRLLLKGYLLWYDERLKFSHFIPAARLQPEYRDRLTQSLAASEAIINKYRLAYQLQRKTAGKPFKKTMMFLKALLKYPFALSQQKKERATDKLCFLSPVAIKPGNILSVLRRFVV